MASRPVSSDHVSGLRDSDESGVAAPYEQPRSAEKVSDYPHVHSLAWRAEAAFRRDLLALLKERPAQWVAYRGEEQVAFGQTDEEAYQACAERGVDISEVLVRSIEPDSQSESLIGPGSMLDLPLV